MDVKRGTVADAELWRGAVEKIIDEDEREGNLISIEEAEKALADDRCYLLLAMENGEALGLLNAYRFPDVEAGGEIVYLYDIEVLERHRQRGVGAALLELMVDTCEDDGVKWIWAGTENSNHPARKAFEATEAELEGDSYVEYEWDLMD